MGIKDLTKLIKDIKKSGVLGKKVDLGSYRGNALAVDVSLYLYKYHYMPGSNTRYVTSILAQITNLIKHGIIPIYVFDGAPPDNKEETIKDRKERTEGLKEKVREEEEKEDWKRALELQKQIVCVGPEVFNETKALLEFLKVPWILVPDKEADLICAILQRKGHVSGVLTEDSDTPVHGTEIWLKDYKNGQSGVTEITLAEILETLEISYGAFVDMCILMGTDYNKTRTMGPKTALKAIRKYGSIEKMIDAGLIAEGEEDEMFRVREIFIPTGVSTMKIHVEDRSETVEKMKGVGREEIVQYLMNILMPGEGGGDGKEGEEGGEGGEGGEGSSLMLEEGIIEKGRITRYVNKYMEALDSLA